MMIPAIKIKERIIIIGMFIGILISGSFLFLVDFFAFLAIRRIRMPVIPPEITPPIPSMKVNFMNSSCVARM